jgi:hypothetical protein
MNTAVPAHLTASREQVLLAALQAGMYRDDICACKRFRLQLAMSTVSDSCAALMADECKNVARFTARLAANAALA